MPYRVAQRFAFSVMFAILGFEASTSLGGDALRVQFDVPDRIECRDVTPEKCAAIHPHHKVIEAKFRISADIVEGDEKSIVDLTYLISSPKMRLKVLDYLPNTTLESRYADDRIEVADFTEDTDMVAQEARVAYTIFSLSAVKNQITRKTEQNQYQRIAPKALVLASGTMNRGHGVFFKLRPSNDASLEGSKEFSFLAIVPKNWRGDWCTFACSARANKKTLFGTSVVEAGASKIDVGLYLCGDEEAGALASRLRTVQTEYAPVLQADVEATKGLDVPNSIQLVGHVDEFLEGLKKRPRHGVTPEQMQDAMQAVAEAEERLARLAGVEVVAER
ncbi:MAG: hypothetical protein JNL96_08810 [Planctomycetaceae bacterium]|nr:hypothetical protein [Planctomycetaceae bacterium]